MLQMHQRHVFFAFFYLGLYLLLNATVANASPASLTLYTLAEQPVSKTLPVTVADSEWQLYPYNPVYLSPVDGESWIRLDIHNPQQQTQLYMVQLSGNELPSVQAFHPDESGQLQFYFNPLGLDHRFADRPIQYRHSIYPVMLQAGESQSLIFRIQHFFPLKLNPHVWQEADFQKRTNQEMVFFGMLYGALCMIVIYSLFIYYSLREKSYLLFLLFGIFTGLFIAMQEGHFYQFIAADKIWPKETFYALITSLMCVSFTLFATYFLDLERRSSWAMRIMLFIGCTISLFLLLLGINKQPIILSHYTLMLIAMIYLTGIVLAIIMWHTHRSKSSGFFAIAISLCTIGLLLEFSAQTPLVPWSRYNYGYASAGNTAMILVFAFALAYKMRVMQQQQLQSSAELLRMTEEKANSHVENYKARLQKSELEKAANEAVIANRTKSEFMATMSSDIRTPMNSILGLTELLDETELDKKQRYLVESINSSAKSLLNVISGLLDYSQIQIGQVSMDTRIFNLEKLVDDCISIFSLQSSESKLYFTGLVTPGTPLQYKGDPDKLRQILLNMLSNAFNFEQINGISLRVSSTGKNTVNSHELRFELICHDVLLSEQDRLSLLTPFDGQEEKTCGHELGLTVSLELVELMQGKLGIDISDSDKTSTLWFTARLITPGKDEAMALPDRSKWLNGRRMLVCDPNRYFDESVSLLTRAWGMETTATSDSQQTITALLEDEQAYQVLMIAEECLTPDVQIAIRKSNVAHNFTTSIILTTRTRFALSAEDMKKQGIQFILEKPWTTRQLYKSLLHSMGIEGDNRPEDRQDKPIKALIAEDNTINLMVLEGLLKRQQLQVSSAADGQQALALYSQPGNRFDIIFMDCEMPEMDGYQATRAIRELESKNQYNTVIIGLSAHADHEYREQALQAGMDDFIVKPVSRDYIDNLIASFRAGHFNQKDNIIVDDDEPGKAQ